MKKLLLTVALCAATFWVIRAQSQRGTVMIQNSGKKALPQVNIVIEGATPTTSDARGCFEVQLPNHIEGRSEERRVGKECRSRWSPYH